MQTECSADLFRFAPLERREVVAGFDGGRMTSDGGALLLGATDRAIGLVERFAECFADSRASELIEHEVITLVGQRVFGMALGYEDLVDHDQLRHDPAMAVLAGKLSARRKDCAPLAGKSTLNRLELGRRAGDAAITRSPGTARKIEALFVDLFLEAHQHPPERSSWIWMPPTTRCTGIRKAVSFTAITTATATCRCTSSVASICWRQSCGPPISTRRPGRSRKPARIVGQIRARWPEVRIVLRADSGFARDALMTWCEANGVDFLFGLARNERLVAEIAAELAAAEEESKTTGQPARRFNEFCWTTRDSWSRQRRVVAKAEWTGGEANPRFVVTSLNREDAEPQRLYEKIYCARGDMENRIKSLPSRKRGMPARSVRRSDPRRRLSTATMRANQLRLWFAWWLTVCYARSVVWGCSNTIRQRHLWHHPQNS